ncbi:MAG: MoaD/ThiS family protein [Candidatus Saliniplasma sp.]
MKVDVEGEGVVKLEPGKLVSDLVKKLDHHQDSVIVLNDGEPLPLDEELDEDMNLKVVSVVSGG